MKAVQIELTDEDYDYLDQARIQQKVQRKSGEATVIEPQYPSVEAMIEGIFNQAVTRFIPQKPATAEVQALAQEIEEKQKQLQAMSTLSVSVAAVDGAAVVSSRLK